jgi:hypothetical protein
MAFLPDNRAFAFAASSLRRMAPISLTPVLQLKNSRPARKIAFAWRHGELVARVVLTAVIASLLILVASAWQGLRSQHQIERLGRRAAQLQASLATKSAAVEAAQPPDFVQTLPDAPSVAQVMQTLQQAAGKEGARVESLQADDHPATETALGRLDLVVSIKAPYPAILVVLQQVLDRYPDATLRQMDLAHVTPAAALTPMAPAPVGGPVALPSTAESEARVLLSFWRRPAGVARAALAATPVPSANETTAGAAPAPAAPPASAPAAVSRSAASGVQPASGAR